MTGQLFAAGWQFLVRVTSPGQLVPKDDQPYSVPIERAPRDEGASHRYSRPERCAALDSDLRDRIGRACRSVSRPVYTGSTWTADAPFRETETAIERAPSKDVLAVETEVAALYTFVAVREPPDVRFVHVTDRMGQDEDDFEKGQADWSRDALYVIETAVGGRQTPKRAVVESRS